MRIADTKHRPTAHKAHPHPHALEVAKVLSKITIQKMDEAPSLSEDRVFNILRARMHALEAKHRGHTESNIKPGERPTGMYVQLNDRGVSVSYAIHWDRSRLLYDFKIIPIHHIAGTVMQGEAIYQTFNCSVHSEVIPTHDANNVVFANAKNQAQLFADAVDVFCIRYREAQKTYKAALEHAAAQLPRSL